MAATSYDCVLVDYGMGNLHSAYRALKTVAAKQKVGLSSDPKVIKGSKKIVLPGVGAISACMRGLQERGLDEAVRDASAGGSIILGVCIGMQLLFEHSTENDGVDCLNIIPGKVDKITVKDGLKVPHMGWNQIHQKPHPMWDGIEDQSYFYFVHSYCAFKSKSTVATAQYGKSFVAAASQQNLFATQFHPEKSATAGLRLLKNFLDWNGNYPSC